MKNVWYICINDDSWEKSKEESRIKKKMKKGIDLKINISGNKLSARFYLEISFDW